MEESSISSNGIVDGYGNRYIYGGKYMEDYQMSEHLWNFLTKEESKATYNNGEVDVEAGIDAYVHNDFKNTIGYKEIAIEDCIDNDLVADRETDDNEVEGYINTRFHIEDFPDMTANDSYIESLPGKPTYYSYANAPNPPKNLDDYEMEFIKATRKGEWDVMEKIGTAHPHTLVMKVFRNYGTALHHTLWYRQDRVDIAKSLVKLMTPKDLETRDREGYTPLALAVFLHRDRDLLSCMIEKNKDLLKIGASDKIPVVVASSKRFRDTTEFLYPLTDGEILSPDYENPHDSKLDRTSGRLGINLLNQCISLHLFGIAEELLKLSPMFIRRRDDRDIYPTHALVKAMAALRILNIQQQKSRGWKHMLSTFGDYIMNHWCYILRGGKPSSDDQESIPSCEGHKLLQLIIRIKDFDIDIEHTEYIVDAMMEAAKHGIVEFIVEILKVDRELISINKDDKNMFWHAIMNRQEKVFNLIYAFDQNDKLLSFNLDDKRKRVQEGRTEKIPNILHFAADLPSSIVLGRISGPALQMQREVLWFKVSSIFLT